MPVSHLAYVVWGLLSFTVKVCIFIWFFMLIRWTLPRFRYDQLMHLGWKILFPLSLANIVLTGLAVGAWGGAAASANSSCTGFVTRASGAISRGWSAPTCRRSCRACG